jgi:alanine dehydrogenase
MALYLTEQDVESLLAPEDALEPVEECFRRLARGAIDNRPRSRQAVDGGSLAVMSAVDPELELAGLKAYAAVAAGTPFVVRLGQLRTGAASGIAARHLVRQGSRTLGVIGCGFQAETQVRCIRAAVPSIERVIVFCRSTERLRSFCERVGAEPGESHRDPADADVVVTVTSSRDPVLRGEWLKPGGLVCAVGANDARRRELDNVVLERAAFVCCDSLEQARLESGDLIEPVQAGVLDWLEVHELHEVVGGEVQGRQAEDDIVVFKSNGIAAWDVAIGAAALERARERGVGTEV